MNKITIKYAVLFLMLSIAGVSSLLLFFRQYSDHDTLNINNFPNSVGTWQGKNKEVSEQDYKILETRNLIVRDYVDPLGENLTLFIIYSETNRSVFHPPEVCLIGSGMAITDKKIEAVRMGAKQFPANKLYVEKDNTKELVFYCYKVGNVYTDNYYLQQALFAMNQLLGRKVGGATIRVSMPIKKSEEDTRVKLSAFMSEAVKIMDSFNP